MQQRLDIKKLEPQAYKVLLEMEKYLIACGLEKIQFELIKIRASQINQCAYCLDMHTEDALNYGETQRLIFALSAWKESNFWNRIAVSAPLFHEN